MSKQTDDIGKKRPKIFVEQGLGRRKEGSFLFNDALNTFDLRIYGVRHMVKDHSDSSKVSFICIIPQTV